MSEIATTVSFDHEGEPVGPFSDEESIRQLMTTPTARRKDKNTVWDRTASLYKLATGLNTASREIVKTCLISAMDDEDICWPDF